MDAERWRRIQEVFEVAVQRPPEARSRYLDEACEDDESLRSEIETLLVNVGQPVGLLNAVIQEVAMLATEEELDGKVELGVLPFHEAEVRSRPQQIGAYRIVRELGRGGMGTVYLGERADEAFRKQVAIKLIRPGMDTDFVLARFKRERQILARLEHPNIARLLDAGSTAEGAPYLVMEYVDGAGISQYCQSHGLNAEQRLNLFLQVCSAVTCAHQNFIVHRDLKPGNILIDPQGVPKLLDFGISKLLYLDAVDAAETLTQDVRMVTPDYGSPEQVLGEAITVASDIYSLGAVLYELLTGTRPHHIEKLTPQAVERAICHEEIVLPSLAAKRAGCDGRGLSRRLSGDLDNILMRALHKDPRRRYASVEQFAEDVRRHLAFLPVKARRDILGYRALKFARRNRAPLLAACAILLALAGGLVVSLREARIARRHFEGVRQLANTFVFDVHDAVRDLPGATRARQLIVQKGLEYLDRLASEASRQPDLQRELAAAYHRVGELQGVQLGNASGARESFGKALALLEQLARQGAAERAVLLDRLGVLSSLGELLANTEGSQKALATYEQGVGLAEAALHRFPGDSEVRSAVAELYLKVSGLQRTTGQLNAASESASKSLTLFRQLATERPDDEKTRQSVAAASSHLGMVQARLGELAAALDNYRNAATEMESLCKSDPSNASYRRNLMLAYSHIGDVRGRPQHANLGDTAGALEAYRKMTAIAHELFEIDPSNQTAMSDYAIALMRQATVLPAALESQRMALFQQSLRLMNRVASVNPKNLFNRINRAFVEGQLGDLLAARGDRAGAARLYRQSIATCEGVLTLEPRDTSSLQQRVSAYRKLGVLAARQGDRAGALAAAHLALRHADSVVAQKPDQLSVSLAVIVPQAYAGLGEVYSVLAALTRNQTQRLRDLAETCRWNEKSLEAWRPLVSKQGFGAQFRAEMEQVEATLASRCRPASPTVDGRQ